MCKFTNQSYLSLHFVDYVISQIGDENDGRVPWMSLFFFGFHRGHPRTVLASNHPDIIVCRNPQKQD